MTVYQERLAAVAEEERSWLITGVAGFIGSNLLECLLRVGQRVRGVDNFATGHRGNLDDVARTVGVEAWRRFELIEGSIADPVLCRDLVIGIDIVLHQAALGSVPRSIIDPVASNRANVEGFLCMLAAACEAKVGRFIYASSSSVYGDESSLPKIESRTGRPLSPYALTKSIDELYAEMFARVYGYRATGLRYFNVFGPRQDPNGAYAAVIPKWLAAMMRDEELVINGDGETSRDFCYIANAIQANILAALAPDDVQGEVFNVAVGTRASLNQLFEALRAALGAVGIRYDRAPLHGEFRKGDVRHSLADIGKAQRLLGYAPSHDLGQGLGEMVGRAAAAFGR